MEDSGRRRRRRARLVAPRRGARRRPPRGWRPRPRRRAGRGGYHPWSIVYRYANRRATRRGIAGPPTVCRRRAPRRRSRRRRRREARGGGRRASPRARRKGPRRYAARGSWIPVRGVLFARRSPPRKARRRARRARTRTRRRRTSRDPRRARRRRPRSRTRPTRGAPRDRSATRGRRHGGGGWAVAASGRSGEGGAVAAAISAADALGEHVGVAARSGGAFARRGRVALALVRGGSRHVDAESRERRGEVAAHGLDARLGRKVRDHLAQRGLARRRRRGRLRVRVRVRRRRRLRLERSLARLPRLHRVAAFLLERERHHLPEMRLLVAVVRAPRRRGLEGRRHRDANVSRDASRPTRTRVATVVDVALERVRGECRPRLVPPPASRREFVPNFFLVADDAFCGCRDLREPSLSSTASRVDVTRVCAPVVRASASR
jgi:hypothetical protein